LKFDEVAEAELLIAHRKAIGESQPPLEMLKRWKARGYTRAQQTLIQRTARVLLIHEERQKRRSGGASSRRTEFRKR
jgi:hypothetical protein